MSQIRPIKLTMNAFGPFVNKTEILFDSFRDHSLFLITGPTGSGKTTIVDAITFAIFGEASGNSKDSENFKSDYADLSQECFVKLEFQLKDKKFIIERAPKQKRKSLKKDSLIIINSKARLILDDGKEIIGVDNVNQKITELFGLSYKQFKQVVILPQGDFKRLLEAKSDEKQDIFRKIFDTEIFARFSKAILEKTKDIEKQIASLDLLLNSHISSIDSYDDPQLKLFIEKFLSSHDKSDRNVNQLLELLDKNLEFLNKNLDKQNFQIDSLILEKEKLNQAISQIKLLEEKNKLLDEYKLSLSTKQNLMTDFQENLKNAKQALNDSSLKKSEISNLIYQKNQLITISGYFKEIDKLKNKQNSLYQSKLELSNNLDQLHMIEKKLILIENLNKEKHFLDNLNNLISLTKQYKDTYQKYKISEEVYLCNYKKFLAGQAGFLAGKLKDNFPCPVCGSTSHPKKATILDDTPSEQLVKDLSLKSKNLRDEISSLDYKILSLYNLISDKLSYFSNINYDDILNKSEILNQILFDYKNLISEKQNEIDKINIDTSNLIIDQVRNNINQFNEESIKLESRILSLDEEILKYQSKLTDNTNETDINLMINDIDKKISEIETQHKYNEELYFNAKSIFEKNNNEINFLSNEISKLSLELEKNNFHDLSEKTKELNIKNVYLNNELDQLNSQYISYSSRLTLNLNQSNNIKDISKKHQSLYQLYSDYASLSEISNGKNPQRISLERFVLASYFQDVIETANIKFSEMTGYRYLLKRKSEKEKNNRASGLDLEIVDNYTGKARNISTLSGGESFKASLALTLGLSEVIQRYSGGIDIDTLFIDEGFGTLDSESLDITIEALTSLKRSGRLIGIISHVNELKDRIPYKLIVKPSKYGSYVEIDY